MGYNFIERLRDLAGKAVVKSLENNESINLASMLRQVNARSLQIILRCFETFVERAKNDDPSSISFAVLAEVTNATLAEPNWSSRENLYEITQFLSHAYLLTFSQASRPIRASHFVEILCRLYEIGNSKEKDYARNSALQWAADPTFGAELFERESYKRLIASTLDLSHIDSLTVHLKMLHALKLYRAGNEAITRRLLHCLDFSSLLTAELTGIKLGNSLEVLDKMLHNYKRHSDCVSPGRLCRQAINDCIVATLDTFNAISRCSPDCIPKSAVLRIFNMAAPLLRPCEGTPGSNQHHKERYQAAALYCLKTWATHDTFGGVMITHHLPKILSALFSQPFSTDSPAWHLAVLLTSNATSRVETAWSDPGKGLVEVRDQIAILYAFVFGFAELPRGTSANLARALSKPHRKPPLERLLQLADRLSGSLRSGGSGGCAGENQGDWALPGRRGEAAAAAAAESERTMWAQLVWAGLAGLFGRLALSLRTGEVDTAFDALLLSLYLSPDEWSSFKPCGMTPMDDVEDTCFSKDVATTTTAPLHRIQLPCPRNATEAVVLGINTVDSNPIQITVDASRMSTASPFFEVSFSGRWVEQVDDRPRLVAFHKQDPLPFLTVVHIVHGCSWQKCKFLRDLLARVFEAAGTQGLYDYTAKLFRLGDFICLTSLEPICDYLLDYVRGCRGDIEKRRLHHSLVLACLHSAQPALQHPSYQARFLAESLKESEFPHSRSPKECLCGYNFIRCLRVILRRGDPEETGGLEKITKLLWELVELYETM